MPGLPNRPPCRVDDELLGEERPPVGTFRGDPEREQRGAEGLVRVMVLAPGLDDLRVEERRGRRDRDPRVGDEAGLAVRDQRLRHELEVGAVGEYE